MKEFKEKAKDFFIVLNESVKSFLRNNNFERAASLAFFGFFSVIPLLLLVFYILGNFILTSDKAFIAVQNVTSQIFPEFIKVIEREVYALSEHREIWGPITIITLFWWLTPLVGTIRNGFTKIFKTDEDVPYFKSKTFDLIAAIIIVALSIILVISEVLYSMLSVVFFKTPVLLRISNVTASFLLTVILMTVFYGIFSPVKVKVKYLFGGALFSGLLWSIMRPVFFLFLKFNPSYGYTFGSLKALFILFVWVYYSFAVILLGAELISNLRKKESLFLKGLFYNGYDEKKIQHIMTRRFVQTYNRDDVIFDYDEEADKMFYILTGSVHITRNNEIINVMKKGEYFGEISLLINTKRTATAVAAEENTQIVCISQDNFGIILKEEGKITFSILKEMAERLKNRTDDYV
ncbi:MAG: YhjD/YihY/BrkB family envelope integrity protein [Candidatus Eremiobacterota bacterium]